MAPSPRASSFSADHCDAGGAEAAIAEDEAMAEEAAAAPAEDCAAAAAPSAAAAEDSAEEAAEAAVESFFLQPVRPKAATALRASTRPKVFFIWRLPNAR